MEDPYNSISYDEQLVAEKLGMFDYKPESFDINSNIKMALMQEELDRAKKQLESKKHVLPDDKREHFTGGCGCNATEGFKGAQNTPSINDKYSSLDLSMMLSDRKILILLVIILVTVCFVQYFSYQTKLQELTQLIYSVIKLQSGHVHPSQPGSMQQSI